MSSANASDAPAPAPAPAPGAVPLGPQTTSSYTLVVALINRYASLARENTDPDLMAAIFTPDGTIAFPDGREVKPTQLGELTSTNRPKVLRHHLTTVDAQFDSEDEARVQGYVVASTDRKAADHWGLWEGVAKKSGERWLLESLRVSVDGVDETGWLAGLTGAK